VKHAYNLVRIGKNVTFVEDRVGKDAGQMLSRLQMLGYGRVDEVRDGVSWETSTGSHSVIDKTRQLNGTGKGVREYRKSAESTMRQMLTARFASQVRDIDFLPESDLHEKVERVVIKEEFQGEVKGTKAMKLLRNRVIAKKRAWADEDAVKYPTSKLQGRNQAQSDHESRKRRKMNGGSHRVQESSDEEEGLHDEAKGDEETTNALVSLPEFLDENLTYFCQRIMFLSGLTMTNWRFPFVATS